MLTMVSGTKVAAAHLDIHARPTCGCGTMAPLRTHIQKPVRFHTAGFVLVESGAWVLPAKLRVVHILTAQRTTSSDAAGRAS